MSTELVMKLEKKQIWVDVCYRTAFPSCLCFVYLPEQTPALSCNQPVEGSMLLDTLSCLEFSVADAGNKLLNMTN